MIDDKDARIAKLEAENKRLECCGDCAVWWDNVQGRTNGCMGRPAQERCHFTPSRWKKP